MIAEQHVMHFQGTLRYNYRVRLDGKEVCDYESCFLVYNDKDIIVFATPAKDGLDFGVTDNKNMSFNPHYSENRTILVKTLGRKSYMENYTMDGIDVFLLFEVKYKEHTYTVGLTEEDDGEIKLLCKEGN